MIEFGHGTHVGLRRARNEDTYYADAALGLFLVADGMGGHLHGEVAAAAVRDSVVELVSRGHSLAEAIRGADEHLMAQLHDHANALPMGSTIAALRLSDDGYEAAWVGDSRIYTTGRELRQVHHDQSLVRALIEAGKLDPSHATPQTNRNVLTQALGVTAAAQLHIGMARGRITPGMGFLLCSDGLVEDLDAASIARTVARTDLAAQECVDQLLLSALDRGGNDNITAILVRSS
jgi:serine/threonine protein phosphatase PrpC